LGAGGLAYAAITLIRPNLSAASALGRLRTATRNGVDLFPVYPRRMSAPACSLARFKHCSIPRGRLLRAEGPGEMRRLHGDGHPPGSGVEIPGLK